MITEWRHVYRRFRNFLGALRPTPVQANLCTSTAVEVALGLRRSFRPGGSAAADYLIIGGLGKGTAIQPADTVDLLYELPMTMRHNESPGGGPLVLLDVAAALGQQYASVEPDKRWLTVLPSPGGPAVRVIPAFPCAAGGYLMVDAGSPGAGSSHWRQINPPAEAAKLDAADQASAGKATHLILMLKAWRRHRRIPLSPFGIELLVTEFVSVWNYQRRSLLFYDWMMRDFFFWLRFQGGQKMPIPGTPDALQFDRSWLGPAEEAYLNATQACLLERDNNNPEAEIRWRQIFGPAFTEALEPPSEEPQTLPPKDKDGKVSTAA
jgi:hypothetical protein